MQVINGKSQVTAKRPPAGNNRPRGHPRLTKLSVDHRLAIQATQILKRLQGFVFTDPDNPKPGDVRMTRTQATVALALLRKVLPDLASVEISGNPDRPMTVQVVRFSDGGAPLIEAVEGRLTGDGRAAGAPLLEVNATDVEPLEAAE